jgi:hypothetical protein
VGNLLPTVDHFQKTGRHCGRVKLGGYKLPILRCVIGEMMELRNRQKKSLSKMLFDGHNGGRNSTRPEK